MNEALTAEPVGQGGSWQVVHLGAGACRELPTYEATGFAKLVLVETDPLRFRQLVERTAGDSRITVIEALVAATAGPVTFYRYNLPDAGSMRHPTGLKTLFPGLRVVAEERRDAVGVADLLDGLNLCEDRPLKIIVDLPGEEASVLHALAQAKWLPRLDVVDVFTGALPLYEGSESATGLTAWMADRGFDLVETSASEDPDRPRLSFRRNPVVLRLRLLETQVAELSAALDDKRAVATAFERDLEQVRADRDSILDRLRMVEAEKTLLAERAAAIEEEKTQFGERLAILKRQCDHAEQERRNEVQVVEAQRGELERLTKTAEALAAKLQQAESRLADVVTENDTLAAERIALAEREAVWNAERDRLEGSVNDLATKLAGANGRLEGEVKRRDEVQALVQSLQDELQAATGELGKLRQQSSEDAAKIEKGVNELAAARDEIKELKMQLDAATRKQAIDADKMAAIELERKEVQGRQVVLDREIGRAEAQIDLIKDLLLRDVGI